MSEVGKREDAWVDVPSEGPDGFTLDPIQLRVGSDETKLRLKVTGSPEHEIVIHDLRKGISLIEEEHAR